MESPCAGAKLHILISQDLGVDRPIRGGGRVAKCCKVAAHDERDGKRLRKDVDIQKRSARDRKAARIGLVLCGDVEANPGPGRILAITRPASAPEERAKDPVDAQMSYQRPKKSPKPPSGKNFGDPAVKGSPAGFAKSAIKSATEVLARQVGMELQQQAGVHDAAEEAKAAKVLADLEAKSAKRNALQVEVVQRLEQQAVEMTGVTWHSCVPGEVEAPYCQVARRFDELLQPFFPFKYFTITEVKFRPAARSVIEDGKIRVEPLVVQQPATADMARAPGPYNLIEVAVARHSVGWFGHEVADSIEMRRFEWSWEQFMAASSAGIATTPSFETNLVSVMRYRSNHKGFLCSDNLYHSNSNLEHQAFTALLMVRNVGFSQIVGLGKEVFFKEMNKRIQRAFISDDEAAPIAGGYYLQGYRTEMREMFPDAWDAALRDFVLTGSVKSATQKFLERATALSHEVGGQLSKAANYATLNYCRALPQPIMTDEDTVLPVAFPDPKNPMNRVVGVIKRLLSSTRDEAEPDTQVREEGVFAALAEKGRENEWEWDPQRLLEKVKEHLSLHRDWSEEAVQHFKDGVADVIAAASLGAEAQGRFIDKIKGWFQTNKVFVKAETYPNDEVKACRFIVAPCHYVRGFTFGLFHDCQKNFFSKWSDHSIKGSTSVEMTEMVGSTETGEGVEVIESDYKSWENMIDRLKRLRETLVMSSYSPRCLQGMQSKFADLMSKGLHLSDKEFYAIVESIRISGEYNTSCGNWISQTSTSFGSISRALGIPEEGVKEWFKKWHLPWRCEGDDGLFVVPRGTASKLFDSFRKSGARVTQEVHKLAKEANFCGKKLVETANHFVVLVDPIEVLGKLSWWLNCDQSTTAHDAEMQVAKATGYLIQYRGVPLVHTYAAAIIRKHRAQADEMLLDAGLESPTTAGGRYLREYLSRRGDFEFEFGARDAIAKAMSYRILDETREAVRSIHAELSADVQRECERLIEGGVAQGKKIILPVVGQIVSRSKGLLKMTQHKFEGKREQAQKFLESAQVAAAATWAHSTQKAAYWGTETIAWLSAFIMPLMGPVAFLWWWWYGCHFLIALPMSFVVILGAWVGTFAISLLLGCSIRTARLAASCSVWFLLVSSILKWAIICRRCSSALVAAARRAHEWVGHILEHASSWLLTIKWGVSAASSVVSAADKMKSVFTARK